MFYADMSRLQPLLRSHQRQGRGLEQKLSGVELRDCAHGETVGKESS